MPALQIAAEHNMRPFVKHRGLMHVRQRPVVVSLVDEVIDGARRIVGVAAHSAETGMKNTDVEQMLDRRRIGGDQIVGDVTLAEALAVQCHAVVLELESLGLREERRGHFRARSDAC